ncbi:MAG: ubiquitin family protein [Methanotrichaceae archaeon]
MIWIKVKILAEGRLTERQIEIKDGQTYEDLFEILNINPETVVALNDSRPMPVDEMIDPGVVEIIHVVSSG